MESIVTDLDGITDVRRLGQDLGIIGKTMMMVTNLLFSTEEQKGAIISDWLSRKNVIKQKHDECPTVGELASAVAKQNTELAMKIRHKYRDRLNPILGERIYCKHC